MKFYYGPYPDTWWNTKRAEDAWLKWNHKVEWAWQVKDEDFTKWDRRVEKLLDMWQSVLNHTINPIIRNRKQKIKVRIDPHDTWGMDTTLAHIILPMLKQLKATKHGSPYVEDEDVPEDLRSTSASPKENEWDTDDNWEKRWDWVMDQMIWSFEELNDPDEGRNHYYVPYEKDEKVKRVSFKRSDGTKEYLVSEEWARERGRYDPDLAKAYHEKVQKGLTLFGKYYRGLWD